MSDVKLPVDATGREIDIATAKILYTADDGTRLLVGSYVYDCADGTWSAIDRSGDGFECSDLTVDPPDSWDELKSDVKKLSPVEYVEKRGLDASYAYGSVMAQDVYRRARALAGGVE